jgi:hypothetical protein
MLIQLDLPVEIYQHVLQLQGELKIKKGSGHYSLEKTIITIIREHKETREEPDAPRENRKKS